MKGGEESLRAYTVAVWRAGGSAGPAVKFPPLRSHFFHGPDTANRRASRHI